jgi:hypothetical protein
MKNIIVLSTLCLMFITISNNALSALQHDQDFSEEWWSIPYPERFNADKIEKKLSLIHVQGKK